MDETSTLNFELSNISSNISYALFLCSIYRVKCDFLSSICSQ